MDGILTQGTTAPVGNTSTANETTEAGTEPLPTGNMPTATTIYDIQMGLVAEGTTVTLEGVIVVSPVQNDSSAVIVQDPMGGPYSALYLYLFDEVLMGVPLAPGDELTITGEYSEFFDSSQLTIAGVADVQITGSAEIPAPLDVSAAEIVAGVDSAEQYEGVPVCLTDVTTTDATNQFGDFHVDDGAAVSNFFLFGTDDFLQVLPGTEFARLCGPLLYSFEEYKVAPRSGMDYDGSVLGCADAAPLTTISEVQQQMFAVGDLVRLEDVVVTTPWETDQEVFWAQDPAGGMYSGIAVYLPRAEGFAPVPGDVVSLCGSYEEFFEQSQIQLASASDLVAGPSGPVPMPEPVTADDAVTEPWEGVLVRIDGPTVTTETDMFGEWTVDDVLRLTPEFFSMGWPMPMVDETFTSLTGVVVFSFDNYKLAPRDMADIVP
ncbi:MAG: hypothetical protein AAGF11_51735 [Myxococcota bacterium]